MEQLSRENPDAAGITFMDGIEYLERPGPEYLAISETGEELGLKDFRILRAEELPSRVSWGCRYTTWCVNPMMYCCFLLNRFVYRGGKVMRRHLRAAEEAFLLDMAELDNKKEKNVGAVVNASGMGFGDADVFPTRGQTCLIANACPETVTRQNADGTWTFSVPRNFDGGTVVGGTKDVEDWDPAPDPKVRAELLARFAETYPAILLPTRDGVMGRREEEQQHRQKGERGFRVLADIVGRRHTRKGGMRLEVDTEALEQRNEVLVHAYGLGGRGFELSWGVAEEVKRLVLQCFQRGTRSFNRSHL